MAPPRLSSPLSSSSPGLRPADAAPDAPRQAAFSVEALHALFAEGGALSRGIPDYHVRAQQLEMAVCVAHAIQDCSVLVCEAGTGTGKTLAYLVPALLSGGKVIVSTGTFRIGSGSEWCEPLQ